ncbi:hypothetical protein [Kocuria marina]|uniref:hypothetical protein n=1 Tax=Kocuria marina TaxID=223184 RepID=UPI0022E31232|nr:hypothetical protein [Kocuria marina]
MSATSLPEMPDTVDFRALAASSPWRFTTAHFTHRRQVHGGATAEGGPVEAWLDRSRHRVVVRTAEGVEVAEGAPYSGAGRGPDSELLSPLAGVVLRPDGLVAQRPEEWHLDHGDPMWQDYRWTAMLDPVELCQGVEISDVTATVLRGRTTWAATCRPLVGQGEDWVGGYLPRCGCCPLLDSPASRIYEYGLEDPTLNAGLATVYRVHLNVGTGIVVDLTPLDGTEGVSLTTVIHDVDEPVDPPL